MLWIYCYCMHKNSRVTNVAWDRPRRACIRLKILRIKMAQYSTIGNQSLTWQTVAIYLLKCCAFIKSGRLNFSLHSSTIWLTARVPFRGLFVFLKKKSRSYSSKGSPQSVTKVKISSRKYEISNSNSFILYRHSYSVIAMARKHLHRGKKLISWDRNHRNCRLITILMQTYLYHNLRSVLR